MHGSFVRNARATWSRQARAAASLCVLASAFAGCADPTLPTVDGAPPTDAAPDAHNAADATLTTDAAATDTGVATDASAAMDAGAPDADATVRPDVHAPSDAGPTRPTSALLLDGATPMPCADPAVVSARGADAAA